jgi:PAS domain S-box-containing protein
LPSADPDRLLRLCRRYEVLAEAEGSIVWVIDPEMRPTGSNENWERYTGQSEEQYAGLGWMAAIHPDDREPLASATAEAHRAGEPVALEIRIRRADGVHRRNLIRALPIRDGGRVVEWIGTATDVEDARQTSDEQRDLRARLLALTEGAEHLLAAGDLAAAHERAVALAQQVLPGNACALWALAPATREWRIVRGVGLSPQFTVLPVEGDAIEFSQPLGIEDVATSPMFEGLRASWQAEGIRSLLTIPLPIGGERRAALVVYYRQPHLTTETELRVGIALGQLAAAALWNAETYEALRQSARTAERHATHMAYLADASAALGSLDYETTLREIAQLAVPGLTDWCTVDVLQPDGQVERLITAHIDPAKVQLAQLLQERYPPSLDSPTGVAAVLRTGEPMHFPLVTDEMLVAGARDTEHLRILRELGLHSAAIVPLVARGRTLGAITFVSATADRPLTGEDVTVLMEIGRRAGLAIDNARLYRDVELANLAKDEFLALLSHELRTPLNAIMGWTHMLRGGLPQDMTAHAIEVIGRNARSQKQLVEDLLDVARIAGGGLELKRAVIDLREVGRVGVDSALPAAQAKGVTLALEAAGDPLLVNGDPNRLQQVIANLLSNAVKFTDKGGRITVRASRTPVGLELSVQDTGVGIATDFLPSVFERFRQADTSLTRAYGGLGLGLWVVKQIAEAHGARVRADSPGAGRGTTVTVTLPSAAVG